MEKFGNMSQEEEPTYLGRREVIMLQIDKENLAQSISQIDDSIMRSVFFEKEEDGDG